MRYFMSDADHVQTEGATGTHLRIQWTNQHGCGGTTGNQPQQNMFCQLLLQFMCRPALPTTTAQGDEAVEKKRDEAEEQKKDDLLDDDDELNEIDEDEELRDDTTTK